MLHVNPRKLRIVNEVIHALNTWQQVVVKVIRAAKCSW